MADPKGRGFRDTHRASAPERYIKGNTFVREDKLPAQSIVQVQYYISMSL